MTIGLVNGANVELLGNGEPGAVGGEIPWPYNSSLIMLASAVASFYHGVKRNNGSIGWGVGWLLLSGIFPILTPVYGWSQGFAKPKKPELKGRSKR